jgi:hypothetical protein
MNFISQSQAGQDLFVYQTLVEPEQLFTGTFLDVGCNQPVYWNNTYALEQLGWRGLLVDASEEHVKLCREQRKSPVLCADATKFGWPVGASKRVDYLSLDVDDATYAALAHLLEMGVTFRVATIEHDSYRLGPKPRDAIRSRLLVAGYSMVREDVSYGGNAYEDWWQKSEKKT